MILIRKSLAHWRELSTLVSSLERCAASCARLDAHRDIIRRGRGRPPTRGWLLARDVDRRLAALREQLDREDGPRDVRTSQCGSRGEN